MRAKWLAQVTLIISSVWPGFCQTIDGDKSSLKSASIDNTTLFWGTYRPNLFFGTRARVPESILTGLMWNGLNDLHAWDGFRHTCEQSEEFSKYGYIQHDGRLLGIQEVHDVGNNLLLRTEFVKVPSEHFGGAWAVRISGKPLDPTLNNGGIKTSLLFYIGTEEDGFLQRNEEPLTDGIDSEIKGETPNFGKFHLKVFQDSKNNRINSGEVFELPPEEIDTSKPSLVGLKIDSANLWKIQELVKLEYNQVASSRIKPLLEDIQAGLKEFPSPGYLFSLDSSEQEKSNLYMLQNIFEGSFELDIVFSPEDSPFKLDRKSLTELIEKRSTQFVNKFSRTFDLDEKGYSYNQVKFAEAAMSNLIGGIGYFHGDSIVKKLNKPLTSNQSMVDDQDELSVGDFDEDDEIEEKTVDNSGSPEFEDETKSDSVQHTEPTSLFTSVPSRPFFPRGFLWDEGFHLLLISEWDNDLSLEILKSWFELIDDNGWIAREQILGPEARSKVPPKFQTQHQDYANPPTLFIAVEKFLKDLKDPLKKEFIHKNLQHDPFLNKYENNLDHDNSNSEDILMTMKHIGDFNLAKDWLKNIYPLMKRNYLWYNHTQFGQLKEWDRSVSSNEAYRWRGRTQFHCLTSGLDDYPRGTMSDGELHVDLMSWMGLMSRILAETAKTLGEEEDAKSFQETYTNIQKNLLELHWVEDENMFCDLEINSEGASKPVCHKGYISILPLALGLLDPNSNQLKASLDLLYNKEDLWSPYGIRSLSKQDPLYYKEESYWRGPIWININYMVLSSLHRNYMLPDQPYFVKASKIYSELRENIINNIYNEYKRTGYLWEQYSAEDGSGQRSRPFTGWTSLVVMIMSEKY